MVGTLATAMQTCMPTVHVARTKNVARQTFEVPVYHKHKIQALVCVTHSTAWARHHLLISHACNIGAWLKVTATHANLAMALWICS